MMVVFNSDSYCVSLSFIEFYALFRNVYVTPCIRKKCKIHYTCIIPFKNQFHCYLSYLVNLSIIKTLIPSPFKPLF